MTKVLVVEDNDLNTEVMTRFLRRDGYEVFQAVSGKEAIATAQAHAPDLILMDLNLPEMDGWEATRRLKADPRTRHIPIIAVTAHALVPDVKRAREAGVDHYVTKPVPYPKLLARIAEILDHS